MVDQETRSDSLEPVSTALVGLVLAGMAVFFAILLFVPAGRLDWMLGWIYVGLLSLNFVITWVCLQLWNPELIAARMRFSKGTKTWDKVWAALFAPLIIAIYIVAGLEKRDGVSSLTETAWPFGLVIFILGSALITWSMVVNPFFEKTVRIQTDRGHRVIDTGPYAYLRHPGYVGFLCWVLSAPLLLASAWALVPTLLSLVGIVVRTALEDRTLREELPGYTDYTKRVRFRLIPGNW